MPTYGRPGVFIEESLKPLAPSFGAPGEAAAAFVGAHNQGPTDPTLVNSWSQFVSLYGGFGNGTDLLPFSVFQYFANGGRRAWIVRAVPSDSTPATITLNDRTSPDPLPLLELTAKAPGSWGSSISIDITDSDTAEGRFNLIVRVGTGSANIRERFVDVSMDPADSKYAVAAINSPVIGSAFISAANVSTVAPWTTAQTPTAQTATPLTGGTDGVAALDLSAAAQTLENKVTENVGVNLPGVSDSTVLNDLITWAEAVGNVFLVIDAPAAAANPDATASSYTDLVASGLTATSVAALYGPWLVTADPSSALPGAVRTLPPGGAVLGQYATTDATRGVQKAAAGVGTTLVGVLGTEVKFSNTQLDDLNNAGVNVIRSVPGAGFCIMGARTLKPGFPDRYISVRRTLMYIKKEIVDGTRFAIFEPNNEDLWARLEAVVTQYLTTMMQVGVLKGQSPDEAFYVKCDEETNDPNAVTAGEVHMEVGVALNSPAEFIVIKIGQFDGGTSVTETATA